MNKYKDKLIKWSNENKKNIIKWNDIQVLLGVNEYEEFALIINNLIKDNVLKAYGSSSNGRKPKLFLKYKIVKEVQDNEKFINEIDYIISPRIDKTYLRKNINYYIENRNDILKINNFILNEYDKLENPVSINERSFQIFKKEKYLKNNKSLIKKMGLDDNFFNYYETSEPIAYYSLSKNTPQNILIIENKDTFYTIRKYMKEVSDNVLGTKISTIVYGGGKSKIPSLSEFKDYTEDYISDENNVFYYFGDIDYEGLVIYESYKTKTSSQIDLIPFIPAYEYMIDKCIDNIDELPYTKEGQNRNIGIDFLNYFCDLYKNRIENILLRNKYIPQEALNYNDLIDYTRRR